MALLPTRCRLTSLLFVGLCLLAIGVRPAGATHFYGGATSWERDFSNTIPGSVRIAFRLDGDWRWSFSYSGVAYPPVGTLLVGLHPVSYSGNGWSGSVNLQGTVTAVLSGEDRMTTRSVLALDVPTTAFPITLDISGCCRISSLTEGNADQSYRITTVVDITKGNRSPRYTGFLRQHVPVAAPVSVDLPTIAFDGLSNGTSIAPTTSSLLRFARPVGIAACASAGCDCFGTDAGQCANALAVSPPNHVAWTPQAIGRYAVQFDVTSRDALGVPKSSVPVDMIVDVQPACPSCPVVTVPATVSAPVGTTLSLPVNVTLPTPAPSQLLYLSSTELPAGATLAPTSAQGSLSATLQWTPGAGDLGQRTVCFQATKESPFGLSVGDTCTVITVTEPTCAAGSYSATGTTPCTPCPANTFADGPGRTTCTPCSTCGAAEYESSTCSAVANTGCGACDVSCAACDGPSAAECTSCPNAEPPAAGACLPDLCEEGWFGVDGREPCTPCPAGSYADAPGRSTCSECDPGTFAGVEGQITCDACDAGTFAAASGATACEPCGTCAGGEFEASACTSSANTTCGTCDPSCAACAGPTPADCTSCPSSEPPVDGVCGPSCSLAPAEGCRRPILAGKSKLDVKDSADDTKDSLKWKWLKGEATSLADFGDPLGSDGWLLCIYDAGVPVSSTELPAGGTCGTKPCWSAKPTGFTYKDAALTPDGAQAAVMKAGVAGKPSISITAKGVALETPTPSAFTGPLRVQLQGRTGCFEATYSAPFKKNAGGAFSDVDDPVVATTTSTAPPTTSSTSTSTSSSSSSTSTSSTTSTTSSTSTTSTTLAASCKALQLAQPTAASGVYDLAVPGLAPFQAYCDMTTTGGGWTVFQRRSGPGDFYRSWADYAAGFGSVAGDHWLGNDRLSALTQGGTHELYVRLTPFVGSPGFATYGMFSVGNAATNYTLSIAGYTGTIGDALTSNAGRAFSTYDADHDTLPGSSCAVTYSGAWWYGGCHQANLNGIYFPSPGTHASYANGINWEPFRGYYESMASTVMMVR